VIGQVFGDLPPAMRAFGDLVGDDLAGVVVEV
jgi:hypothetical protein